MPRDIEAQQVIELARLIAGHAPERQNQYAYAALIPWSLIWALREALDALDAYDESLFE